MKNLEGFTFGCDPEVFVINGDGEVVPAWDMIPGTKEEPFKVEFGAVQVDGLALEFNIDPVDNFKDFDRNIVEVMKQMKSMIPKGHNFLIVPSTTFPQNVYDALPEKARELGCDPDFNAWNNGEPNVIPEDAGLSPFRTAAGHLHIGWEGADLDNSMHKNNCIDLVKQLDWFLAASHILTKSTEEENPLEIARRNLYGKAGAFRVKPYGVEYRTLSNFWIKTKNSRKWVWNRMCEAIYTMSAKEFSKTYLRETPGLQTTVNEGHTVTEFSRGFKNHYPITTANRGWAVNERQFPKIDWVSEAA